MSQWLNFSVEKEANDNLSTFHEMTLSKYSFLDLRRFRMNTYKGEKKEERGEITEKKTT